MDLYSILRKRCIREKLPTVNRSLPSNRVFKALDYGKNPKVNTVKKQSVLFPVKMPRPFCPASKQNAPWTHMSRPAASLQVPVFHAASVRGGAHCWG